MSIANIFLIFPYVTSIPLMPVITLNIFICRIYVILLFYLWICFLYLQNFLRIGGIERKPCRKELAEKEVFQVMKGKDLHPRLLYLAKLSFRMEGQIKCFPDKVMFKEFIITKSLHEMFKGLI